MRKTGFPSRVALVQGIYYLLTGIWPILSRRSFEKITGPKVDFWLVRTIGGLISVIGAVLTWAGLRGQVSPEAALLGIGSAASLGGSDVIYSARGRISPVYLVESLAEIALVALWLVSLAPGRKDASVLKLPTEHGTAHRL